MPLALITIASLLAQAVIAYDTCAKTHDLYSHCFKQCGKNPHYDPGSDDYYTGGGGTPSTSSTSSTTTTTTITNTITNTNINTTTTTTTTTSTTRATSGGGGECNCPFNNLVDSPPYKCNKEQVLQFCKAPWDTDGDDMCCSRDSFDSFALTSGCKCGKPGSTGGGGGTEPEPDPEGGSCSGCRVSDLRDNPPWTCDKAGASSFCKAPWDKDGDDQCCSSPTMQSFALSSGCKC